MKLLDLFCGAGGCSVGYERAGFEVLGVDVAPQRHHRGGTFVQADALEFVRAHGHEFDAIHASPPCQAHTSLRHVAQASQKERREYPDLIPATRAALVATGKPHVIENVPGAPLGGGDTYLLLLCGTMFGLVTPDGRAEIRRHRLFETNWCFGLRPACQHGGQVVTVAGHDYHSMAARSVAGHAHEIVAKRQRKRRVLGVHGDHPQDASVRHAKRRAMTVTGGTPQTNVEHNAVRETFSVVEARAAMGISWMVMKELSQAIPPCYTEWIGLRLLAHLEGGARAETPAPHDVIAPTRYTAGMGPAPDPEAP